ncbi:tetratricopeptide repeat protein [Campylobacter sputorum]|uniref:tetratricopeptide repeat protein n=1 Tax=Campylobacter sputorum TaxID=206 RepID=UPI00053C00B9|nr:tetratricopeptide repeat protein [Campylobacter sputorum]
MADEENIVILETGDELTPLDEIDKNKEEPKQEDTPKVIKSQKKFLIIGIVASVLLLVVIVCVILFFIFSKTEDKLEPKIVENKIEQPIYNTAKFAPNKIDDMIKKANSLYEKGDKIQALQIYKDISTYNESISNYNLGVSQMRQNNCELAIESFRKAINDMDNATVSALNAAACSLELGNADSFDYFLNLAHSFLVNEADSPLFNYYIALVHYYNGFYYEALKVLNHTQNYQYKSKFNYLKAKILTFLGKEEEAIYYLQNQNEFSSNFTIGLLYAKIGKFSEAKDYLKRAQISEPNRSKISTALSILNIKTGFYKDAANLLKELTHIDENLPNKIYNVSIGLNTKLFDINIAQNSFEKDMFENKIKRYEMIFYFVPYQVFDVNQALDFARKGAINLSLDNIEGAQDYLGNSTTLSKVNAKLSSSIAKAIDNKLREANKEFKDLLKVYPQHAIVHYNLALSYAKLQDFKNAAKYFTSSYHLNPNNHISGALAIICNDILKEKVPKLLSEVSEGIRDDDKLSPDDISPALLHLSLDNLNALISWSEIPKKRSTLNVFFETMTANLAQNEDLFIKKSSELNAILPNDIMANLINFVAKNHNLDIKSYAKNAQIAMQNNQFNLDSFYYGPYIVKEQFIKLLQISGFIHKVRSNLKNLVMVSANSDKFVNLLETLAYVDIYANNFDEAYVIYNRLIDTYAITDASLVFYAAVASVGASQYENAIAMLELARITNPNDPENRIPLAMLYHSINNMEAAINQYDRLGNSGFISNFFTLDVE